MIGGEKHDGDLIATIIVRWSKLFLWCERECYLTRVGPTLSFDFFFRFLTKKIVFFVVLLYVLY